MSDDWVNYYFNSLVSRWMQLKRFSPSMITQIQAIETRAVKSGFDGFKAQGFTLASSTTFDRFNDELGPFFAARTKNTHMDSQRRLFQRDCWKVTWDIRKDAARGDLNEMEFCHKCDWRTWKEARDIDFGGSGPREIEALKKPQQDDFKMRASGE